MQLIKFSFTELPVIKSAGIVEYFTYIEQHSPLLDDGKKFYQLMPNGAQIDYGEGARRLLACANSPEEAWEKVKQDKQLLEKFGIKNG